MADLPVSTDIRDLDDDLREVFAELASHLDAAQAVYARQFQPRLDVIETTGAVEVDVDVSGVPAQALRVVFRGNLLLLAGAKSPAGPSVESTFHLVEREFGRFARAVRLTGAFDLASARATLASGVLTVLLPKRAERRGRGHAIDVRPETTLT